MEEHKIDDITYTQLYGINIKDDLPITKSANVHNSLLECKKKTKF